MSPNSSSGAVFGVIERAGTRLGWLRESPGAQNSSRSIENQTTWRSLGPGGAMILRNLRYAVNTCSRRIEIYEVLWAVGSPLPPIWRELARIGVD